MGPPMRSQDDFWSARALALALGHGIVMGRCQDEQRRWDTLTGEAGGGEPLTWAESTESAACGSLVLTLPVVELDGRRPVVSVLAEDESVHRVDLITGNMIDPSVRSEWRPRENAVTLDNRYGGRRRGLRFTGGMRRHSPFRTDEI
jgi:hypothetical protein